MNNKDIHLSKSLSWILRHGAIKEGLHLSSEGYTPVNEILQHKSFRGKCNVTDIERIVLNNDKQRFKLKLNPYTQKLEIKANQGHSITEVTDTELTPILQPKYETVVHGTYLKYWSYIKQQGLSRMKRQHIHLAKGTIDDKSVVSGARRNIELFIFINLKQALEEGIRFYESSNGVILTPGNSDGYLETKYFLKVKVINGEQIYPETMDASRSPQIKSTNNARTLADFLPTTENFSRNVTQDIAGSSKDIVTSLIATASLQNDTSQSNGDNSMRSVVAANNVKRTAPEPVASSHKINTSWRKKADPNDEADTFNSPRNSDHRTQKSWRGHTNNAQLNQTPATDKLKVIVTGYAPYTQPQDITRIFNTFGSVNIEKMNTKLATLSFNSENEAQMAVKSSGKVNIYGEFLTVQYFSPSLVSSELSKNKQHGQKMLFPKSKQKAVGIVEPKDLDFSGSFYMQLERILAAIRLTQEEVEVLGTLYSDVQEVLQEIWPNCVAMPFGSITSGLGIKTSDADCFINLPPEYASPNINHVKKAKAVFQQYPRIFSEILSIPQANTPIVKFFHVPTNTNCDVSFKTMLGVQNSKLIAFFMHIDPRLIPVAVIIKYWSKIHELSGQGKLSNYALTLLFIFYLQQPPMCILPSVSWLQSNPDNDIIVDNWNAGFIDKKEYLPPCSNTSSISELLGGFFEFYSMFNFEEMIICPYLGTPIKKSVFKDINQLPPEFNRYQQNVINGFNKPLLFTTAVCIQDPFDHSHNVASAIWNNKANEIKAYLKFAANAYEKEKLNNCEEFLEIILTKKPKVVKEKTHPEFRVYIFPRTVATIIDPNWRPIVRSVVFKVFEEMLKLKLGKVEEKVNPDAKKQKEKYTSVVNKAVWKRKQFTRLYSVMKMDFERKQARITDEVIACDKEIINIQFQLTVTYCSDPKSAVVSIKMSTGDLDAFREFGKFFVSTMSQWFMILLKPHCTQK